MRILLSKNWYSGQICRFFSSTWGSHGSDQYQHDINICFNGNAICAIFQSYHPYLTIPSLPLQASLLVYSYHTISSHLATFLAGVLAEKQLLSNKALHLFLQTQITMEKIMENMEGKRDDEVVVAKSKIIKDDRNNAKEGFGSLFGSVTQ